MKLQKLSTYIFSSLISIWFLHCDFRLDAIQVKTLDAVMPLQGPSQNAQNNPTKLTLSGTGFTINTKIVVGKNPATVVSVNSTGTELQFLLPNSPGSFGPTPIVVTYEDGTTLTLQDETTPTPKKGFSYYLSSIIFQPQTSPAALNTAGGTPANFVTGNFDNDAEQKLDLAVVYSNNKALEILSGNGQGKFSSSYSTFLGTNNSFITTADLNQDNLADLVVTPMTGNSIIYALKQEADHSFNGVALNVGQNPSFAAVADVDGDGLPDVVTTNKDTTNPISVSLNISPPKQDLNFQNSKTVAFSDDVPQSVFAQDFDGDGKADLAILPSTARSFYLLKNTGNGTFGQSSPISLGFTPQAGIGTVLSNGPLPEIALIHPMGTNKTVEVFKNQSTTTAFTFTKADMNLNVSGTTNDPNSLVIAADFDQDGFKDLIVNNGSQLSLLFNRSREGQGLNFQPALSIPSTLSIQSIVVADFTGDGLPDIVVLPTTGSDLILFKNISQ